MQLHRPDLKFFWCSSRKAVVEDADNVSERCVKPRKAHRNSAMFGIGVTVRNGGNASLVGKADRHRHNCFLKMRCNAQRRCSRAWCKSSLNHQTFGMICTITSVWATRELGNRFHHLLAHAFCRSWNGRNLSRCRQKQYHQIGWESCCHSWAP